MRDTLRKRIEFYLSLKGQSFTRGVGAAENQLNRFSKVATGGMSTIAGAASASAIAIAAIAAASSVTAARTEVLNRVLRVMGNTAGISTDALNFYKEGIRSLGIAEQQALRIQTRFMQANLNVADSLKVARAAQNLAVLAGEDSSATAQKLTDAINMQRPILLKQFGIVASLEQIYGKLSAKLGTNNDLLTDTQKKQAFLNTILEKAETVQGVYIESMKDVGKRLTSLPRHLQDAANSFGQWLLPALEAAVDGLTDFLVAVKKIFATTDQLTVSLVGQARQQRQYEHDMLSLVDTYDTLSKKQNLDATEKKRLIDAFQTLRVQFPEIVKDWSNYNNVLGLNTSKVKGLLKAQKEVLASKLEESVMAQVMAWQENRKAIELASAEMSDLRKMQVDLENKILARVDKNYVNLITLAVTSENYFEALKLMWEAVAESAEDQALVSTLEQVTGRIEILQEGIDKLEGKGGALDKIKESLVQVLSLGDKSAKIDEALNLFSPEIRAEILQRAKALENELANIELGIGAVTPTASAEFEKAAFKQAERLRELYSERATIGLSEDAKNEAKILTESENKKADILRDFTAKFEDDQETRTKKALEALRLLRGEQTLLELEMGNLRLESAQSIADQIEQINKDFAFKEFETAEERLAAEEEAATSLLELRQQVADDEIGIAENKADALIAIDEALEKYRTTKEIQAAKLRQKRYEVLMKGLSSITNAWAGNEINAQNKLKSVALMAAADTAKGILEIEAERWKVEALEAMAKGEYRKAALLSAAVIAAGAAGSFIMASAQRSADAWNADPNDLTVDPTESSISGPASRSAISTRGAENVYIQPSISFTGETLIVGDAGLEVAAETIGNIAVARIKEAIDTGELSVGA